MSMCVSDATDLAKEPCSTFPKLSDRASTRHVNLVIMGFDRLQIQKRSNRLML